MISLLLAAAIAPSPDATAPDATAPSEAIVLERVEPAEVVLDTRFDRAQLVAIGRDGSGQSIDLTPELVAEACDLVRLDEFGGLHPVKEGEGTLTLKVGSQTLEVPVRVGGYVQPPTPAFLTDVQPVLSKTGCNTGVCHGNVNGKNGFKLSLRGYDAAFDHFALTDDLGGRRFDRVVPEESLFLRKPAGEVPHEGGAILEPGSPHYELLRAWVAGGATFDPEAARVSAIEVFPNEASLKDAGARQQFRVVAKLEDGRVRDVTREAFLESNDTEVASVDGHGVVHAIRRGEAAVLVRYEGHYVAARVFVMGDREGWTWEGGPTYSFIDERVNQKLETIRSRPSGLCTDAEFLRRVSFDLTGRAPTVAAVEAFLLDQRDSRQKRTELVDRLIGSPEFVEHWTNRWSDLLQVNSKFLGAGGAKATRDWVRGQVASNRPYNEFVADLLGASGSTLDSPAGGYWRVHREPDLVMENTTQLFLGIRFNCNKCHDHPFERWTQDQHWQLASYFSRIGRDKGRSKDEEILKDLNAGEVKNPDTGDVVPPAFPYEHGAMPPEGPRRAQLVSWMTAAENPYFATSYVNRLWSYFLGSGLIDPVDDLRAGNPPTHPELLDELTMEFVNAGFDARHVMRLICNSHTYQRSLDTNRWNEDDKRNFAHAYARRLPAEVLYDAIHQAAGISPALPGQRPGTRAAALVDSSVKSADGFLDLFGRPPRESVCECERVSGVSLGQALNLVNGPTVANALADPNGAVTQIGRFVKNDREALQELYLRFLGRPPSDDEFAALLPTLDPRDIENLAALDPASIPSFHEARAAWEKTVPRVDWHAVEAISARSEGGATIEVQDDGSWLLTGANPERDRLTLTIWTERTNLTGLRLEALPDDSLPARGPGRAENGNFVLGELEAVAIPQSGAASAKPLTFNKVTADFSQNGWPVAAITDGNPGTGWAVSARFGQVHQAILAASEPFGSEGGTMIVVTLNQPYGSQHTLGRLRLSVTESKDPRYTGVSEDLIEALDRPENERSSEDQERIHRAFVAAKKDWADRIRAGGIQDVAWALANSPAFLFNR